MRDPSRHCGCPCGNGRWLRRAIDRTEFHPSTRTRSIRLHMDRIRRDPKEKNKQVINFSQQKTKERFGAGVLGVGSRWDSSNRGIGPPSSCKWGSKGEFAHFLSSGERALIPAQIGQGTGKALDFSVAHHAHRCSTLARLALGVIAHSYLSPAVARLLDTGDLFWDKHPPPKPTPRCCSNGSFATTTLAVGVL